MPTKSLPDRTPKSAMFCFVLLARENDHLGGFGATIFGDLSINPERSDLTQGGVRGCGAPPVA